MLFAAAFLRATRRAPVSSIFARCNSTTVEPVVLRPYQENCIDSCLDALASGSTRIGVSLPTGSGKTTVFISLLSRIKSQEPARTKSLVIVNSIELAKQAAFQALRLFPDWTVEIEQGQKHVATAGADLTVATYQTLTRGTRLQKFNPAKLKAIVIDEAHHAAAKSYLKVLSHFDEHLGNDSTNRPPSKVPIIGFSATFSRHDGLTLGSAFDRIVYHRDFLEMIKEEWLCTVRFTSVKVQLDLSNVTISAQHGDFSPTSLAHVINTDTINQVVLQAWLDRASHRKSTLIFCVNLAHVHDLTQVFRESGIDARYLHSGTPSHERTELLTAFRAQEFPVLINCAILTEGADIPNIDCVLIARPTRSRNVFAQMIGRGMRLSPATGKTDCHIIDFVDSTTRVQGIVTTPTLFGLTPGEEEIEDATLEDMERRAEAAGIGSNRPDVDVPDPQTVTYKDYDNPFALVNDTSGCPDIHQMSSFAWVGVGDDTYVLECLGNGFIKILPWTGTTAVEDMEDMGDMEPERPAYAAEYIPVNTRPDSSTPFFRPRPILVAANLRDAVRGADTYAKTKACPGRMSFGLHRSAKWRKEPASNGQKEFIAKRWGLRKPEALIVQNAEFQLREARLGALTKGAAGDIISRIKHGAVGRFAKTKKKAENAMAKAMSTARKEKARRQREVVRVGPLARATL